MKNFFPKSPYLLLSAFVGVAFSWNAQAAVYKFVDDSGHTIYSNTPMKGAKKLDIDTFVPSSNVPNSNANRSNVNNTDTNTSKAATKTITPSNFPKVDKQTQSQRDEKRKDILQAELSDEKSALESAKKAYAEGESKPEVYKTSTGATMRNVAKFDEKMKALQADVDAHQRNIELLQKELTDNK